ncbi:MAG: hypothetical protein WBM58_17740 [Sedimenticolaceae bacterium]
MDPGNARTLWSFSARRCRGVSAFHAPSACQEWLAIRGIGLQLNCRRKVEQG